MATDATGYDPSMDDPLTTFPDPSPDAGFELSAARYLLRNGLSPEDAATALETEVGARSADAAAAVLLATMELRVLDDAVA
jgi:hypothetical protein